jgi:hypothetical protein
MLIEVPAFYEGKDGLFTPFNGLSKEKKQKVLERAYKKALKKEAKKSKA